MPSHFSLTDTWIRQELSAQVSQLTLIKRAYAVYFDMHLARHTSGPNSTEAAQAAGLYGGLMKTWRSGLIEVLTRDLLQRREIDPSRLRVHRIQHEIFGRGLAIQSLNRFSRTIRNGGGRAAEMNPIPEPIQLEARDYFLRHQDDLKTAVQNAFQRNNS